MHKKHDLILYTSIAVRDLNILMTSHIKVLRNVTLLLSRVVEIRI